MAQAPRPAEVFPSLTSFSPEAVPHLPSDEPVWAVLDPDHPHALRTQLIAVVEAQSGLV